MINTNTLYSLDKKGNPILWMIKWDDESNWYTMTSGRVNGALTETKPTYCKGKNPGKANETTDIEQCLKEVTARIEKQIKKDFHDEIPQCKRFEVTLAKEFNARKKFLKFPMYASAKLDGFRCYITKDGMFSRQHNKIVSCPHIMESFSDKLKADLNEGLIIDGELYCHELKDDFNKIASMLSKSKNISQDDLDKTEKYIKFHLFDMAFNNMNQPINDRVWTVDHESNKFLVDELDVYGTNIVHVNQIKVNSFDEIETLMDRAISEGFEGLMLRDSTVGYENGRSSGLIKYKRFIDSEYRVVDIEEGDGNAAGLAMVISCEGPNNQLFKVSPGKGWDESLRRDLFVNKDQYINKLATIVYQALTPVDENGVGGVPRFGKLKCFI